MMWQTASGGHSQVAVWPWGRPCIEAPLPAEPMVGHTRETLLPNSQEASGRQRNIT